MPILIHSSVPLARWITAYNHHKWTDAAIIIAVVVVGFPGGFGWIFLHELVWRTAGADYPFSFLLAIAALLVALAALLVLAWFVITTGFKSGFTYIAEAVAAVAVVGTTIVPAVMGTTSVLNGIGFSLATMAAYSVWLSCALIYVAAWRVKHRKDIMNKYVAARQHLIAQQHKVVVCPDCGESISEAGTTCSACVSEALAAKDAPR